jgi:predicted nucleic acid-binding protein
MRYLLDTNIVSELRKGSRCDLAVVAWEQAELIPLGGVISVLTIGEIRKGIELISERDRRQAARLEAWLTGLFQEFVGRILPVSREVAEEWGRLNALRPLPAVDSLLGATAKAHALILATRNVRDLRAVGVHVVNPFEFGAGPRDNVNSGNA